LSNGAAVILIAHTTVQNLSDEVVESAEKLSKALNELREETLKDALEAVAE